jgi:hypothetical protein
MGQGIDATREPEVHPAGRVKGKKARQLAGFIKGS